ncbi:MAG: S9 family peptidase [Hyphomonadaceae bacterium]|nr:S9 family peptidase [Hyphomonadaceae bacterium]
MLALGAPALAQPAPAAEVYGRLPVIQDAAISPDGRHVAMVVTPNDRTYARIFNIDTNQIVLNAYAPEGNTTRGVGWANETTATVIVSRTLTKNQATMTGFRRRGSKRLFEYYRVQTIAVPRGRTMVMLDKETGSWANSNLDYLQAPVVDDPGYGRMVAWTAPTREGRLAVYRVDLSSGDGRVLLSAPADSWDLLLDETGRMAARTESQDKSNSWKLFARRNGRERLVLEGVSETGVPPPLLGLFTDGRLATIDAPENRDRDALYSIDLDTGVRTIVHEAPHHDIADAILDPWTRRAVGVSWTEEEPRQHFFDPELEAVSTELGSFFRNGHVSILSWSRDQRRFLVLGENLGGPPAYQIYEPETKRFTLLGSVYPDIQAEEISAVSAITYRARDGVRIPAYLTVPRGRGPNNLPLVVLVHGGPHSRDSWTFDWWAQFLASRGYMVLQPNFRGSSGYGEAWREAGRREWGGRMQTDVEDGVVALVRGGRVDAKRVCIIGASYGGYAALAGATLTPDRYTCAVSVNGVSDLSLMLQQETDGDANGPTADFWQLSIGNRAEDAARIRAVSPANLAANVRAPVLLMHSTEDSVVPPEQTKIMARRLRDAGKPPRVVVLTGDDHWLSAAATRTQMLEEIETFLAQHLAASAAPPASPAITP